MPTPYMEELKDRVETGRKAHCQPFRETLHEVKDPNHLSEKTGCFVRHQGCVVKIGTKILFFEKVARTTESVFRDNILCDLATRASGFSGHGDSKTIMTKAYRS